MIFYDITDDGAVVAMGQRKDFDSFEPSYDREEDEVDGDEAVLVYDEGPNREFFLGSLIGLGGSLFKGIGKLFGGKKKKKKRKQQRKAQQQPADYEYEPRALPPPAPQPMMGYAPQMYRFSEPAPQPYYQPEYAAAPEQSYLTQEEISSLLAQQAAGEEYDEDPFAPPKRFVTYQS